MKTATDQGSVTGRLVRIGDVDHYHIDGVEGIDPFLMTVVSDADLWMFVSSCGALTAGRVDADHALFPYETDDRLHRAAGVTGPVTVLARTIDGRRELWRPFDRDPDPSAVRALAKSLVGDRVVFEERHLHWGLTFRVTWAPSSRFGWVRTAELIDVEGKGADLEVLDGFLDVMPPGVGANLEQVRSNLVDAYKRSETGLWGTAAVYTLESLITDRAEPAEALEATLVWSAGFPATVVDLDERSVAAMVAGRAASSAGLVTGRRGAYLLRGPLTVGPGATTSWVIVADIGLDHSQLINRLSVGSFPDVVSQVDADVAQGSRRLRTLLAGADAFQTTGDAIADAHHVSNVLFNSMRGGVFPHGYRVPIDDFLDFLRSRNRPVHERHHETIGDLGEWAEVASLRSAASDSGDPDLTRLVLEYLPLAFSRRHGDPSRPWNRFSIQIRAENGDEVLAYEGNWRDIFQNWEALLQSYPRYLPHAVAKFVNASTVDGHNPYRISRAGIDWEVHDPSDPWSHIGYWGDHQIVYLLRLLQAWERFDPGEVGRWLERRIFTYADVPYRLAGHEEMVADPRNTITFDDARAAASAVREEAIGSDGRLVVDADGELVRVGLLEKLLVPALAKLSSYVPGGGIWLNTQRPEWNDANNALAGSGLSMVTLYYLDRYLGFLASLLSGLDAPTVELSAPVAAWLGEIDGVLDAHSPTAAATDGRRRRQMLDALSSAGARYRDGVVAGFDQHPVAVATSEIAGVSASAREHITATLELGRRSEGLYDSYNLVSFTPDGEATVGHLGPMLEGQVAVLSSGALDGAGALAVVDALFASGMYRADLDSFMLYPARTLPPFLDRNRVPPTALERHPSLIELAGGVLAGILVSDLDGGLHFGADMVNGEVLHDALQERAVDEPIRQAIENVYEDMFHHHSFTGRSGAMYGYEGIGSVYWHMVAKLLVAVQEAYWTALDAKEDEAVVSGLREAFRRIRSGLGFCKDPVTFGAIPTDCYSHSPDHAGAQQPGMTGQVKEEILTRFGELGVRIAGGRVALQSGLLEPSELFAEDGAASFTLCGVPISIRAGDTASVRISFTDGRTEERGGLRLSSTESAEVFGRSGSIIGVEFTVGRTTVGT